MCKKYYLRGENVKMKIKQDKAFIKKSNFNGLTENLPLEKKYSELFEKKEVKGKIKTKREPLPMKRRAFPQSFWRQPNKTLSVSPGIIYDMTSILSTKDEPMENRESLVEDEKKVSEPNVDLLFSLFRQVEDDHLNTKTSKARKFCRGRPKIPKTTQKNVRDDDPYLTLNVTDTMEPLIARKIHMNSLQYKIAQKEKILSMATVMNRSSEMLSVDIDSSSENYSQILSDLVVQL